MDVRVLSESENKLFNRKEVRFEVVHEGEPTPKLLDVKRDLAQKVGGEASHVIIDGFKTLFGIGHTVGDARVYDKLDDLKDYEPKYLLERNKVLQPEEEKKEEGEAPEVKPVEAPVEKPVESPKEEAKSEAELVEEEALAEEDKRAARLKEEREAEEVAE